MTTLERYGFGAERRAAAGSPPEGEMFGRVVSAHGDYFHLVCDAAEARISTAPTIQPDLPLM